MKYYLTLLIFFATAIFINAQNDYQPGYIVLYANDTTRGLIEYGFNQNANFNKCKFKLNDSSESTTYLAGEIMEYMLLDQKLYVSKNIPIGDSTKLAFVEVLVKGAMNLYYYINKVDPVYFIEKENGEIFRLENEIKNGIVQDINDKHYTSRYNDKYRGAGVNTNFEKNTNRHIGILHYALSDCPEINQQINNTQLNHNSLIKLTKDYHNYTCTTGEECLVYKKSKKITWSFGLYAGYLNSRLQVNKGNFSAPASIPQSFIGSSYDIGGTVELSPVNRTNKFSFVLFSGLSSLHLIEENPSPEPGITFPNEKYMDVSYWHNSFSVKYTYPLKKVKPYIHTGFKAGTTKIKTYELRGYYNTKDNWIPADKPYQTPISPFFYGLQAGGGLDFFLLPKLVVFIDISYSYEFSNYNRITNLHLKSGIRF